MNKRLGRGAWGWAVLVATSWGGGWPARAERTPGEEVASLATLATGRVAFTDPENEEWSGRVSLQETALMSPLAFAEVRDVSLAAGAWAGWTRLDFRGHPELDTEDLYGLAAFLSVSRPADKGWGWSVMAMPGFYSDFRSGRTGEGKAALQAALDYSFSPAWEAQLGVAYDTAFGDPSVYPVGGVLWKPGGGLTLGLLFPWPYLHWAPSDRWGFFGVLQPAGDRWIVDDDEAGEQVFLIEGWRAGVGVERRVWGPAWLRVGGGVEFGRRYEALSGSRTIFDDEVDDTWYATIALVFYGGEE